MAILWKDDGTAHQGLQEAWGGDATERSQCEEEITAEQKRRETQERKVNIQMDAIMEELMKVAEDRLDSDHSW